MADWNWVCPYCQHAQTVGDSKTCSIEEHIGVKDLAEGSLSIVAMGVGCANKKCRKLTFSIGIYGDSFEARNGYVVNVQKPLLTQRNLLPESSAKHQPIYIPEAIREDYLEACRIRDLSPKASATLSRRCLQGMIRDFAKVSKPTLYKEIAELRRRVNEDDAPRGVTIESVEAIDHVRGIGNVGAHMEKDIDVIIPVDPGEAQLLIELIETLFQDWYVERHKREQRFAKLAALAEEKKLLIENGGAAPADVTIPTSPR